MSRRVASHIRKTRRQASYECDIIGKTEYVFSRLLEAKVGSGNKNTTVKIKTKVGLGWTGPARDSERLHGKVVV